MTRTIASATGSMGLTRTANLYFYGLCNTPLPYNALRLTRSPPCWHGNHVFRVGRSCAAAEAEGLDSWRVRSSVCAKDASSAFVSPRFAVGGD